MKPYLLSVLVVAAALTLQYLFSGLIGEKAFLLLYPAVFYCSMRGGFWPGIVATFISIVGAIYLFFPKPDLMVANWFAFTVFASSGILLSIYCDKYIRMRRKEQHTHLELLRAKEEAEAANIAKSQFLANMSHEIRTPLGVMVGFADLAMEPETTSTELKEYLSTIRRNGRVLTDIIGEILDLSRIENKKLEIEKTKFSLNEFLHELVVLPQLKAKEKGIVLKVEISTSLPMYVRSDAIRLKQILNNLIDNAIKFTERGCIVITVSMPGDVIIGKDVFIEFDISDTGIGLTENQRKKLFKPFSQVDNSLTRKYGGTGLGLVLSREFARALGGELVLKESVPGRGSCFSFFINAGQFDGNYMELASTGKVEDSTQENLVNKKVLIVEDSEDNRVLVGRYLSHAGVKVDMANNGREGVDKALKESYDAILMDLQMPVLDGHQATQQLRKNGYVNPIIALTAHALKAEKDRAIQNGFDAYLTKPISPQTLLTQLSFYFG